MKKRATFAIYGIKDRNSFPYPAYVHDHNVCLMQDGKIVKYLQLERFTRRKYDNRLDLFIEELIDSKALELPDEFDVVCVNDFVGSAFVSKNGRLHFEFDFRNKLDFSLTQGRGYFQYSGWEGKELPAYLCSHEVAHICSTLPFYGMFKENSLLVSIDGGSSLGNYASFLFKDGKFQLIENNWNDLGFASKLFNDNALSFKMLNAKPGEHCSVPGKLMGFASWGTYDEKIEKWLKQNDFFRTYWNREEEILHSIKENFGVRATFATTDPFMQNIAATMQRIFENAILDKLRALCERFRPEYLYYGGGCALNIVTNTKIIESGMFKDVFIAPCCNDSGLSVGAAAFMEILKGNEVCAHSPYLCNCNIQIDNILNINKEDVEKSAEALMRGGIVGVCNGDAEIGPRALGNRSLLALPNSKEISKRISMEVKKREWYRPVAPIMLKALVADVAVQESHTLSKYMLMDFSIREEMASELAGVVHCNGTARIQTIECEKDNPFIFRLLTFLYEKYGVRALINTSFNAQGEPIVHTVDEAMASARRMKLDGIVMNGKFFEL